ncbi:MAG: translation initiation factor IF-6 [Methanobacteriaceae archaeon]|nr:translation initiation factor IF-6 [Methanobacteriaceae archaeon]
MIQRFDIDGNPNLGVSIVANEKLAIVSPGLQESYVNVLKETLNVPIIKTPISGSNLAGVLITGNSNGLLVSEHVYNHEMNAINQIEKNVTIISDKLTALGNVILINDEGAIVSPSLSKKSQEIIKNNLDVEVKESTIAGYDIVGSVASATNKGALVHPNTKPEEISLIEDTLKVPVEIGTVNRGIKLVGSCIVANSNGVVVGTKTTGPELARIEEAYGFFEGTL